MRKDLDEKELYCSSVNLVSAMIQDAKVNMVKGNEFAPASKRFLLNRGGQLHWLLEPLNELDTNRALKECKDFATHDYRNHTALGDRVLRI